MNSQNIHEEFIQYKRYVSHLQYRLNEGVEYREITFNINRDEAYKMDILIQKQRDALPLKTNYYLTIPTNIRLQNPTPVLLERITPNSIKTDPEQIEEYIQYIDEVYKKSIEEAKYNLKGELKQFLDCFFEKHKDIFKSISSVFLLENIAKQFQISLKELQSYYLEKFIKNVIKTQEQQQQQQPVKYQLVRYNKYFCPICNLYLCSLHYHAKNQRVYIDKQPEEEYYEQRSIGFLDNFYETQFKPNQEIIQKNSQEYLKNNIIESRIRCFPIDDCGRFKGDSKIKLKKFQQKSIEMLNTFGFSNCCFITQILQHPLYELKCSSVAYYLSKWRDQKIKAKKKKQQLQLQPPKKQNQAKAKKKFQGSTSVQYIPCFHEGDCNSEGCDCLQCHQYCCCHGTCSLGVKGCDCKGSCGFDEKKQKNLCPCHINARECDSTICKCSDCQNKNLQNSITKRLVLGKSLICNGLGLFAGQNFKQHEYIGEYTGCFLLLDEESQLVEQCDWVTGNHYLFEVDDKWQVDGTYYSNRLRFINHSEKLAQVTNCQAQILFSQGKWRIAMYSTRTIQTGEELYFDYGDKFKTSWLTEFQNLCKKFFS